MIVDVRLVLELGGAASLSTRVGGTCRDKVNDGKWSDYRLQVDLPLSEVLHKASSALMNTYPQPCENQYRINLTTARALYI